MKRHPVHARAAAGFSLVEMLVSTSILVLLVVMVTQLTNHTTATSTNSRKRMDADSQARMIFDRMANDFANMVRRKDVDYLFAKQPGNDSLFFYSEAPSYFDTASTSASSMSTVALVGYRINAGLQLERLGKGLTWAGASNGSTPGGAVFLFHPGGRGAPDSSSTIEGNWPSIGTLGQNYVDGTDADYHLFADQAYRLEISFLLNDGTISTKPVLNPDTATNNLSAAASPTASDDNTQNYAPGSRWYDASQKKGYICVSAAKDAALWRPIGIQDISAIIVGLGILDKDSLKIVPDTGRMVSALPEAVDGVPISQTWGDSNYLTQSGIPKTAAAQIRIYQRTFYLNNK